MLQKILKELSKHSVIYSVSWIANSFASILLLPIYTRYLSRSDYGILEMLELTKGILNIIIVVGLSAAIGKFYSDAETYEKKQIVITSALWYVGISAVLWKVVTLFVDNKLALLILGAENLGNYIDLAITVLLFDILIMVCLTSYQVEKQSGTFVSFSLSKLVLSILSNIIFIVFFKMGAKGMLYGNLLSSSIMGLILVTLCVRKNGIRCNFDLLSGMLKFGIPFAPALLCATLMHNADRYILRHFTSLEVVAIYSLGYKFPFMLGSLFIESFGRIWNSSVIYTISEQDAADELYGKITTYFVTLFVFAQYTLSVTASLIIKVMAAPAYYEAYRVVPIVSLAVSFYCLHNFFIIGALIKKRTAMLPFSYIISGGINVMLNWYYIPIYGYMAAAWISVLTYFIFSAVGFIIYRQIYRISFEYKRLAFLFFIAISLYIFNNAINPANFYLDAFKKVVFVCALPLVLLWSPFLEKNEQAMLSAYWKKYYGILKSYLCIS